MGRTRLSIIRLTLILSLVQTGSSLLLLRSLALASFVPHLRLRPKALIVEFILAIDSSQAAHSEHVVTRLHGPIDTYELTLQANVHDVHVDVYCVFAVGVHRLPWEIALLIWILPHK